MHSLLRRTGIGRAMILATVIFVLATLQAQAINGLPEGFSVDTIASGFNQPTAISFAPDGRIFVAEKGGSIRVIKDGAVLPQPLITLEKINTVGDRGLIGMALDPNFDENGFIYLSYTYENNPSEFLVKTARVVRATVSGDTVVPGSEITILGSVGGTPEKPSCEDYPVNSDCIASDSLSHTVGGINFGLDGKLYVATGDGAGFQGIDLKAFRSQDLDHLSGKILRINTDGTGVSDNPFFTGNPDDNRSKVWSYGLRNPYRFTVHPVDGRLIGGEVGWFTKEEVNHLQAGKNYGWPCREGTDASVGGYTSEDGCPITTELTDPVYDYFHEGGRGAVTGGSFALSSTYPEYFRGSYMIGDFALDFIKYLRFDENTNVISVNTFASSDVGAPVEFTTGPSGLVYYLSISQGELRVINYTEQEQESQDPVAQFSATKTETEPFRGIFDATSSFDPEGESLTYSWDFGDGTTGTGRQVSHEYGQGEYTVTLTVSTPRGDTNSATTTLLFTTSKTEGLPEPILISAKTGEGTLFVGSEMEFEVTLGSTKSGSDFNFFFEIVNEQNEVIKKFDFKNITIQEGETQTFKGTWTPFEIGNLAISYGFYKSDFSAQIFDFLFKETPFEVVSRTPDLPDPQPPTDPVDPPQGPTCYDAPPLGNNKGWDGEGNCHVNGEPWVPGISDQPGYQAGDTLDLEPENPTDPPVDPPVDPPTDPVDPPQGPTCYDAPPLGNNKGWDGEGNCHVNGEPWVPGISDQPGYQAGDTVQDPENAINIFDGGLSTSWVSWSWNTNLNTTELVGSDSTPSNVLQATYTAPYAGVYLYTANTLQLDNTKSLQLTIRAEEGNVSNDLVIALYDQDNREIEQLKLSDYGTLTNGQWVTINIPVSDFTQGEFKINGLVIQEDAGILGESYSIENIQIGNWI